MDSNKVKVPTAEYLHALFRELENLWPTAEWSEVSHGIAWDKETQSLQVLFNVGDSVFACPLAPGDITDDPVATAAHLAARGRAERHKPESDSRMISFKR